MEDVIALVEFIDKMHNAVDAEERYELWNDTGNAEELTELLNAAKNQLGIT